MALNAKSVRRPQTDVGDSKLSVWEGEQAVGLLGDSELSVWGERELLVWDSYWKLLMAIKTCLFDMGNVLVYFSHEKMCRNIADVCDATDAVISEILMGSGFQWQLERGEITEQQFHATFQREIGKDVDFEALKHAAADIFWLNESIVPLLDELKRLGIRLVLLSNTSVTHLNFIQRNFDVLQRFDALTTSFEVGVLKPAAAIYEDALAKANCPAGDCFYTDDIEDYVLQARVMGINAEQYTDTQKTRAALRALGVDVALT